MCLGDNSIADNGNCEVRMVTANGVISRFAGTATGAITTDNWGPAN